MRSKPLPLACDASVVYNLGHRGRLEMLAAALHEDCGLLITPDVEREVTRDPHEGFYEVFLRTSFTRCDDELTALAEIPAEFDPLLGDGERSVLSLARQRRCMAAIDEALGRKAALAMGLELTETLGLLEMAVRRGWMNDSQAMDAVFRLHQNRFFLPVKPGANDDFRDYLLKAKLKLAGR